MTAFTEVIRLLPELSAQELSQVKTRVGSLVEVTKDTSETADEPDNGRLKSHANLQVVEQICSAMNRHGLMTSVAIARRHVDANADVKRKINLAMTFIRKAIPDRRGQVIILNIGLDLLLENMRSLGLAVTANTMLNHLHRLPAVIDQAFPGYAQLGLLKLIVKRKRERKNARKQSN